MLRTFGDKVERARLRSGPFATETGDDYGYFAFKLDAKGPVFAAIASPGDGAAGIPWEHVSVSTAVRCPTWEEMCKVKAMFFGPDEWVVQFHPPEDLNVSNHRFCLHMWRPLNERLPVPPSIAVGIKSLGELNTPEKVANAYAALRSVGG